MNPFRKSPTPLKPQDASRWVCVKSIWDNLNELVERNENTVILGVEGSGKTSLLNMFFSSEYCTAAVSRGKLVFFADPSNTTDGNDLCHHFIMQLQRSVNKNLPETVSRDFEQYLEKIKYESEKRQFTMACDYLYDKGFMLLMVMDRFEQFVSSKNITQDQHDMLRSLLDEDKMRCVVATDYDLEESSLPEDIVGSLYLQKFQQKITLTGFSLEEAQQFVARIIPADSAIQLSEKRIGNLYNLTGGIPLLFEQAACHMYELLERNASITNGEFRAAVFEKAKHTIRHWFKFFTQAYIDVSIDAAKDINKPDALHTFRVRTEDTQNYAAAARLRDRGLLLDNRKRSSDSYVFNSLLLQMYLVNEYLPSVQKTSDDSKREGKPKGSYNVFISYKRTVDGAKTRDSEIAMSVYKRLCKEKNFVPFLDVMEMPYGEGHSDFWKTIFGALETAQAYIFIATQGDFVSSPCVETEWETYTEEMAAGRKRKGSVYGVLEGVEVLEIPLRLRKGVEMFPNTPEDTERLVIYLQNQFADK